MNEDLPAVVPLRTPGSVLSEADIRSFLAGMKPGYYRTADLYPRYLAWTARENRDPVTAKTLGEVIRRKLTPERGAAHGHVAAWKITAEMTRG